MSDASARAIMILASVLMRDSERGWSQAMAVEFEQARQDGHGLCFALGCVLVAVRRLAGSSAGWQVLTRYAVALAVLLPMALFHLGCAGRGLWVWLADSDPYLTRLEAGNAGQQVIALAYRHWSPPILLGLTALGCVHILIAWWIAASDWRRAGRAMIAAALVVAALLACIAAIQPSASGMLPQCVALIAEILAVPILAAWQGRPTSSPTL